MKGMLRAAIVMGSSHIAAELSGIASRLVTRKYFGKVPKYRNARGEVTAWQLIDRHSVFQIYPSIGLR